MSSQSDRSDKAGWLRDRNDSETDRQVDALHLIHLKCLSICDLGNLGSIVYVVLVHVHLWPINSVVLRLLRCVDAMSHRWCPQPQFVPMDVSQFSAEATPGRPLFISPVPQRIQGILAR
jgi:hypothetical protein